MNRYLCTFERIGRKHDVGEQEFVAEDAQQLADALYNFVRKHLGSREVEVFVNLDGGEGHIVVGGFRPAGDFEIETLETP